MKFYPALDIQGADLDSVLAAVDDYGPTAAEERNGSVTIYFSESAQRDRARDAVARAWPAAALAVRDVSDEDWAERSQRNLHPVTVGRVTIAPPWAAPEEPVPAASPSLSDETAPVVVVVQPSMGFGTGHHATTRLCLAALQTIDLTGMFLLDVGTGSGVLAMAARRLGARRAVGIDNDPDAIEAARANLPLNPGLDGVDFRVAALESLGQLTVDGEVGPADVLTANLTGALLCRIGPLLLKAVRAGGFLIVSGLLDHERDNVVAGFADASLVRESVEDRWVGLVLRTRRT
jgi:ribosomal protein L11 methyltransferase